MMSYTSSAMSGAGLPVSLRRVEDVGRHRIIRADLFGQAFNLIAPEGMVIGADMTRVVFAPDKINVFADDWRVAAQGAV